MGLYPIVLHSLLFYAPNFGTMCSKIQLGMPRPAVCKFQKSIAMLLATDGNFLD